MTGPHSFVHDFVQPLGLFPEKPSLPIASSATLTSSFTAEAFLNNVKGITFPPEADCEEHVDDGLELHNFHLRSSTSSVDTRIHVPVSLRTMGRMTALEARERQSENDGIS